MKQFRSPKEAVRQAFKGMDHIWSACKKRYPIHPYPYHGLNWVLTNGNILYAFCYTDPKGFGKSKALCNTRECYYQLRKKITKNLVLVASEPLDKSEGWSHFRHGELLIVKRSRDRLVVQEVQVL